MRTPKVPQLSKPQWLYQTVEGENYLMAEGEAWRQMYYATYGWHKHFAGSVGSYPPIPIKWTELVKRAWENAEWQDDYERKVGSYRGTPRNPTALLAEARNAYDVWEAAKTYGQYVKQWHASGQSYLPEPSPGARA